MTRLAMSAAVALTAFAGAAHAQDAEAGKRISARCAVCHGIGETTRALGPSMNGVVGRTAGTGADYEGKYSKAMVEAGAGGLVWDEANLSEYLLAPRAKLPGNKMAFAGIKDEQDRLDVIAYIKTFE